MAKIEVNWNKYVNETLGKADVNLDNLSDIGESKLNAKANTSLSNLSQEGEDKLRAYFEIGVPILTLSDKLGPNEIWLEGAIVSRKTYDKLFAIYGTTYDSGDGFETFGLPDFRNKIIIGGTSLGYSSILVHSSDFVETPSIKVRVKTKYR